MSITVFNAKYASILNRCKATIIDTVLIATITFLLIAFGGGWHRNIPVVSDFFTDLFYDPEPALHYFIFVLLFLAYDASLSSSALKGSWGKHLSNIKITSQDHLQISVFRAFLRTMLKLLCLSPCLYLLVEPPQTVNTSVYLLLIWYLFLGLFWLYSSKFQFPYDFLAKTLVVPN